LLSTIRIGRIAELFLISTLAVNIRAICSVLINVNRSFDFAILGRRSANMKRLVLVIAMLVLLSPLALAQSPSSTQ
jgi:hypothetical protein